MKQADIITLSDDGSVAVPAKLRSRLKVGDVFIALGDDDKVVLEKVKVIDEQLLEDLEFSRRTREAWKRYDKGEFRTLSVDEFLKESATW